MEKKCWHCNGPLSLTKRLKGDLFCSKDHEQLYHAEQSLRAIERVKIGVQTASSVAPPAEVAAEVAPQEVAVQAAPQEAPVQPLALPDPTPAPVAAAPPSLPPEPEPERKRPTSEPPPLGGLLPQFQFAALPPETLPLFPEDAVDLTSAPIHPALESSPARDYQLQTSATQSFLSNASADCPASIRQSEPGFLQAAALAFPVFKADIAVQKEDLLPSAPPLVEWDGERVAFDGSASLPVCEPMRSQVLSPAFRSSETAEIAWPGVMLAGASISDSYSSYSPGASSDPAESVEPMSHNVAARHRFLFPELAPSAAAPRSCGILTGVLGEPSSTVALVANPPMLPELARRNAPSYGRTQKPVRVSLLSWVPPAVTAPLWEPEDVFDNRPVGIGPWTQPRSTHLRPGVRRYFEPRLVLASGVDGFLPEQKHLSPGKALERAPSVAPSLPVRLPVESVLIAAAALERMFAVRELPLLARGGREAAILPQDLAARSIPLALLILPRSGTRPGTPALALWNSNTISFGAIVSGSGEIRLDSVPRLEPAPAIVFSRPRNPASKVLVRQPADAFALAAVDSTAKFPATLSSRTEPQLPATLGTFLATPFLPRLAPVDRRAEYRVLQHRTGGGVIPKTWIAPTRVRAASLLAPLPTAKPRWRGGLEYCGGAFRVPVPHVREGETPFSPPLQNTRAVAPAGPARPEIAELGQFFALQPVRTPKELSRTFVRVRDNSTVPVPAKSYAIRPTPVSKPVFEWPQTDPGVVPAQPANVFRMRIKAYQSVLGAAGPLPRRRGASLPRIEDVADKLSGQNWALL